MIDNTLTSTSNTHHCAYCFDVIKSSLENKDIPIFPQDFAQINAPLFVTWTTTNGDLRGCIGTFDSHPISRSLATYAHISAFQDSRFKPIQESELEDLKVSVQILYNFQKDKKYDQWEIGTHGIIIDFTDKNYTYNATFLPNVPVEHNLDKDATLKQLIRKSGYTDNYQNVLKRISLTTYESSISTLSYKQWDEQIKK